MLLVLTFPAAVRRRLKSHVHNRQWHGHITKTLEQAEGVIIPDTINGLPVTAIGGATFRFNTNLTGVTMPDSVTNIGYDAFYGCTSLTSVAIPHGVRVIHGRHCSGSDEA